MHQLRRMSSSFKHFALRYPSKVKIVEVGLRDGLQNESIKVSTADKIKLTDLLIRSNLKVIEIGSFVSPKWVPQMADTPELVKKFVSSKTDVSFPCLVPNLIGFHNALESKVTEIALFTGASESFVKRNINCSIEESFLRFQSVLDEAKEQGIRVRGYVSCVMGCPYEGRVDPVAVSEVAYKLYEMGCYEVSLGDTIGKGTPLDTHRLLEAVGARVPVEALAMHFHDTYGQALANIAVGLQHGVSVIDSAVGGLGGCPYAKGASGNVATEDVLYMLNGMEIETGVDMEALLEASRFVQSITQRPVVSKAARALLS